MTTSGGDDLLALAARALREEADRDRSRATVDAWQGMHGWRDVSRDIRRAARRRRIALTVMLQLGVAVVGVGAWAAVSGRLPLLGFHRVPAPPAAAADPGPRRRPASGGHGWAAPPAATPALLDPVSETAPAVLSAPVPSPESAPLPPRTAETAREPRVATAPLRAPRPAPAAVPLAEPRSDADEIYRRAHHAHFVLRDPAAALALWDQYLAVGGGSLTLEARYNRAIALVRLHRRQEAIAALAPFAAGEHDGYRQEEAQALLRLLQAPPP